MGAIRTIIIYALIILNAAVAIYMEMYMTSFYRIEMAVILFGLLASLILMISLAVDAEWSWPFSVIFFSAAIANNAFEFSVSKRYLAFLLVVLVNLFGFLISILSIASKEPDFESSESLENSPENSPQLQEVEQPKVETYEVKESAGKRRRKAK